MFWKRYETWFKGALIGLVIALIFSIGLTSQNQVLTRLSILGLKSCYTLTECTVSGACDGCIVIAFMLNLFYGFIIGAVIGLVVQKIKKPKKFNNTVKKKKKRKK